MTHWQRLPDALDPDVRRLVEQLRLLKDRSGHSLQALAESTACSKSAWQRYLNGTKFPPRSVVAGLGRLTGADAPRLMLLWEVAEAAWIPEPLPAPAPLVPALRPAAPVVGPVVARGSVERALAGPVEPLPPVVTELPLVVPGRVRTTPRRPLVPVFALAGGAALLATAGVLAGPALWSGLLAGNPPGHRPAQDSANSAPFGATAAGCSGAACQGRDPHRTGCDRDAAVAGSVDVDTLIIRLRYSHRCGAVWTEARGGTPGMSLGSLSISGDNGSVLATLPRPGAGSPVDHSPILAATGPDRAEACAVVDDVQACAGARDPGGPPRVLTYLPSDSG
ncbi:XRE family transcriptional regulator [Streptacidiphilus sp. P02-A3a]|uniref:helix-turn-helix domain-containing protein n=1 Tax=Streptacidiphilus sp. P02-A3a TaxID=2704468 RepID=UPI0015FB9525|nr:XRE family transcriptional regulator [Streptacidiphilus sp. P02-A3a]QMU72645.1 DUF2690 domain-containing protein [Streptacidiphilus sp. P02-A3a]